MSISEQVRELRDLSEIPDIDVTGLYNLNDILAQAADTIESLSAKLADMERSAEDCGGGWIICNKYNLPKEKGKYWVTYFWSNKGCVELCDFEDGKFYPSSVNHENVYAWKPCDFPKPYCEDEPKYEYES